jgi:hypothetical protein
MVGVGSKVGSPRSEFLRELAEALAADARGEVELAAKVGTLLALGYRRGEIMERLVIRPRQFASAKAMVERAAERIRESQEV